MNTSTHNPLADHVEFTNTDLVVYLKDARVLSVPLAWFPKLASASQRQLQHHELLGDGEGIHWLDLDEDLSISGLLLGVAQQVA